VLSPPKQVKSACSRRRLLFSRLFSRHYGESVIDSAPDPGLAPDSDAAPALADAIATRLRAAGCVFAEDEARVLLADPVPHDELERRIARRVAGEPLEYLVGWTEFCGLRVTVTPGVFVPRQRTALLVREALRVLPASAGPVVLDLCCGAGAIGAAILAARPDVALHAADLDPDAVSCARSTLAALGRAPADPAWAGSVSTGPVSVGPVSVGPVSAGPASAGSASVGPVPAVYVGDLYAALPAGLQGGIDLITVNAPYVPTDDIRLMPHEARDYEALAALDGGADGLALHRRVAADARGWLAPGGHVVIETSERQASVTAALFEREGFAAAVVHDEENGGTVVVARRATS
jgi:release factor glutamine methyltransferase